MEKENILPLDEMKAEKEEEKENIFLRRKRKTEKEKKEKIWRRKKYSFARKTDTVWFDLFRFFHQYLERTLCVLGSLINTEMAQKQGPSHVGLTI